MFDDVDFRKAHISLLVSVIAMIAAFAMTGWEPSEAEGYAIVLGTYMVLAVMQVWQHRDAAGARRAPTRSDAGAEARRTTSSE